jgi:hypothetical protein
VRAGIDSPSSIIDMLKDAEENWSQWELQEVGVIA